MKTNCSKCGNTRKRNGKWCLGCSRKEYQRDYKRQVRALQANADYENNIKELLSFFTVGEALKCCS